MTGFLIQHKRTHNPVCTNLKSGFRRVLHNRQLFLLDFFFVITIIGTLDFFSLTFDITFFLLDFAILTDGSFGSGCI